MRTARTRAAPMPPALRRAAIIDATIPLLRRHGPAVTTRQIADAAGIAEGTVFRAFADKDALIDAAVAQLLDPAPTVAALRRIDTELPLRERLLIAVEVITARLDAVWEVLFVLRMTGPPEHTAPHRHVAHSAEAADRSLPDALTALIAPDAGELRVTAAQTARLVRLVTFAGSHPRITDADPLTPEEMVDLLLDGLLARPRSSSNSSTADSDWDTAC